MSVFKINNKINLISCMQFCPENLRYASNLNRMKPLIVAGPSGAGKGTLLKKLRDFFPNRFGYCISCTSRGPRHNEENGVHYFFISREEFLNRIAKNQFLEFAETFGNLYGTPVSEIERNEKLGKICLLEIDTQGVNSIKNSVWGNQANYVFVMPPSIEELEKRLRNRRTDDEEKIKLRIADAHQMMSVKERFSSDFDKVIVNDKLEDSFELLKSQVLLWYPTLQNTN